MTRTRLKTPFNAGWGAQRGEIAKILLNAGAELSRDVTAFSRDSFRILQRPIFCHQFNPDVCRQMILRFWRNLPDSEANDVQTSERIPKRIRKPIQKRILRRIQKKISKRAGIEKPNQGPEARYSSDSTSRFIYGW